MEEQASSLKKTARLAGFLYLLLAIIAPFGVMYVPSRIMVKGDAAATAANILANECLFRAGIATNLIGHALFVLLVLVLYRLLREVNGPQAKLMVALVIVGIPVVFLSDVFKITALMVLKGGILDTFEPGQVNEWAGLFLKTGGYGVQMVQLYWGLWLIPFGQLVYKSGFIPRILGVFLIVNGVAYIVLCFIFLLLPDYRALVFRVSLPFLFLGELSIIFWLLIKGVTTNSERVKQ